MNFITWSIIVAEISFWIVILIGLLLRYVYNLKKWGTFFLLLTPVIDLFLLIITAMDLARGGNATVAHGLAAVYLGVSIAFGKSMIQWADERFVYYIKKEGVKRERKTGLTFARHTMKGFFQHVLAYIIGAIFLSLLIYLVNDADRSAIFVDLLKLWAIIVAFDFVVSISYFIWPRKK